MLNAKARRIEAITHTNPALAVAHRHHSHADLAEPDMTIASDLAGRLHHPVLYWVPESVAAISTRLAPTVVGTTARRDQHITRSDNQCGTATKEI